MEVPMTDPAIHDAASRQASGPADAIRDAHDNLKAGIALLKGTGWIPDKIHKAMHALSYAVKAVETPSETANWRESLAKRINAAAVMGIEAHYQNGTRLTNFTAEEKAEIVRALSAPHVADAKAEPLREAEHTKPWPGKVPEGEPSECDGSAWDKLPPAPLAREAIAKVIWHRFAPDHHERWEDEMHSAEYLDCADAILALASPAVDAQEFPDITNPAMMEHWNRAIEACAETAEGFPQLLQTSPKHVRQVNGKDIAANIRLLKNPTTPAVDRAEVIERAAFDKLRVERLVTALDAVQWAARDGFRCVECGGSPACGHADGCRVGRALADAKEDGKP
jgi:hypothetical protein